MKTLHEQSLEVTKSIIALTVSHFNFKGDEYQFQISVHPVVSNAMYAREKELLEEERFRTIISLARVMNDADMSVIVKALGYTLTVKK